jgi:hypothetical protein
MSAKHLRVVDGPVRTQPPEAAPGPDRAELRATVLRLAGLRNSDGSRRHSNREIARQLGTSKDTVRRWLVEDAARARHDEAAAEPAEPAPEPPAEQPKTKEQLSMQYDDKLRGHLAVLAEGGLDEAAAVAHCIQFVADAVAGAWAAGVCPRGVLPAMRIRSVPPARRWLMCPGGREPGAVCDHEELVLDEDEDSALYELYAHIRSQHADGDPGAAEQILSSAREAIHP